MDTNRVWLVGAGLALWAPLLFSFLGAMSLPRLAGTIPSQAGMVALLVSATLLLGMLIGRAACGEPGRPR